MAKTQPKDMRSGTYSGERRGKPEREYSLAVEEVIIAVDAWRRSHPMKYLTVEAYYEIFYNLGYRKKQ